METNNINDNSEIEKRTFFIHDIKQKKIYLIKSEESVEIISIINILNAKNKDFLEKKNLLSTIKEM